MLYLDGCLLASKIWLVENDRMLFTKKLGFVENANCFFPECSIYRLNEQSILTKILERIKQSKDLYCQPNCHVLVAYFLNSLDLATIL